MTSFPLISTVLVELLEPPSLPKARVTSSIYEIEKTVGGRTIMFIAIRDPEDDDHWRIDFAEHLDADVDEPFVSHKTGKGKEFEVFAFVVAAAQEFERSMKPKIITIKSKVSEGNRAPLYHHLAKRFGSKFDIESSKTDRHDVLTLTRKT